jgi:hypothetical protein
MSRERRSLGLLVGGMVGAVTGLNYLATMSSATDIIGAALAVIVLLPVSGVFGGVYIGGLFGPRGVTIGAKLGAILVPALFIVGDCVGLVGGALLSIKADGVGVLAVLAVTFIYAIGGYCVAVYHETLERWVDKLGDITGFGLNYYGILSWGFIYFGVIGWLFIGVPGGLVTGSLGGIAGVICLARKQDRAFYVSSLTSLLGAAILQQAAHNAQLSAVGGLVGLALGIIAIRKWGAMGVFWGLIRAFVGGTLGLIVGIVGGAVGFVVGAEYGVLWHGVAAVLWAGEVGAGVGGSVCVYGGLFIGLFYPQLRSRFARARQRHQGSES